VRPRRQGPALLRGPSTSPLDATRWRSAKLKVIVRFDAPDILFLAAAVAMLSHVALSAIVRSALGSSEHQALRDELFAVPNRWLGRSTGTRYLRVGYFLPFRALPSGADQLPPWVRATLLAARVCGLCFVCAILGFFVALFIQVGR
jgi:hypothetical protein